MCEPVAAVARAPLKPKLIILLGVGSNPGREQKNEHIFFSVQTFSHFLICIEFVINKGVFTSNRHHPFEKLKTFPLVKKKGPAPFRIYTLITT